MNSKWTSLNPPSVSLNSKSEKSSSLEEEKQFLNLLKTIERETKDGNEYKENDSTFLKSAEEAKETILESLISMENLFMRRGLLEYDTERALAMHSKMNDQSISSQSNGGGGRGSNGKKRKRGPGGSGGSGNIASILGIDAGNTKCSVGKEAYVLSNLCRILIPTSSSSSDGEVMLKYPSVIINASSNVMIAICRHCRNHLPSMTATVELSLILSITSQLLSGLSKTIQLLLASIADCSNDQDCSLIYKTISSCCSCASLLISSSGTRLSRNVKVMENIRNAAEALIWYDTSNGGHCDEETLTLVKESSADLIAVIPLASNSNSVSPSKLWTNQLNSVCKEFLATLNCFFPNLKRVGGRKRKVSKTDSAQKPSWIKTINIEDTSQAERINILSMRIDGYLAIILSFLKMNNNDRENCGITCMLPMDYLLSIVEQMLAFAPLAENKYVGTKPRLRNISVEDGLLSPNAAMTVANSFKYQGHILAQTLCSLMSNSSLIYGKQLIEMTVSSIQSCSSSALKIVVDPVSFTEKNSNKKWLHSSISLRSMAVQSFACVMQRLGSNAIVCMKESTVKGLIYVVGCILEQISDENMNIASDFESEHWGTEFERTKLVETCVEALASCLSIFGGYIPNQNREMIESVAETCLEHAASDGFGSVYFSQPSTKLSCLKLGISCVTAPWEDGSASTLLGMMKQTAASLRFDRNFAVSSLAYTAVNICNALVTARAPPLVIVKRDKNVEAFNDTMNVSFSKEAIEQSIVTARKTLLEQKHEYQEKIKTKAINNNVGKVDQQPKPVNDAGVNMNTKDCDEPTDERNEAIQTIPAPSPVQNPDKSIESHETMTQADLDEKVQRKSADTSREDGNINPTTEENNIVEENHEEVQDFVTLDKKEELIDDKYDVHVDDNEKDEDDEDDEFPMIVDCDPDDEDME